MSFFRSKSACVFWVSFAHVKARLTRIRTAKTMASKRSKDLFFPADRNVGVPKPAHWYAIFAKKVVLTGRLALAPGVILGGHQVVRTGT